MTFYEILGITPAATADEIKSAYRAKAKECHPDVAGDESGAKMRALNEAYEVLSDESARREYDANGYDARGVGRAGRLREIALSIFADLVNRCIAPHLILSTMRKFVTDRANSRRREIPVKTEGISKLKAYLKAMKPRVKTDAPDIFTDRVNAMIAAREMEIEAMRADVKEGQELLKLLDAYEFGGSTPIGWRPAVDPGTLCELAGSIGFDDNGRVRYFEPGDR